MSVEIYLLNIMFLLLEKSFLKQTWSVLFSAQSNPLELLFYISKGSLSIKINELGGGGHKRIGEI